MVYQNPKSAAIAGPLNGIRISFSQHKTKGEEGISLDKKTFSTTQEHQCIFYPVFTITHPRLGVFLWNHNIPKNVSTQYFITFVVTAFQ